jgi:spore coat polysaccharide biosynthesis predicted glycosyltransferase SpsG
MEILFRTKGNHKQGMGDVVGSLAIADAFQNRSSQDKISFLIDNDPEAIQEINTRGYKINVVENIEQEISYFQNNHPDTIIVNMLKNDMVLLKLLKQNAKLLVTIDDSGAAAKLSDIRINPLYYTDDAINDPGYIALGKEFICANKNSKIIKYKVGNILITQGGSDTYGLTPKIINALNEIEESVHINVVVGPAFKNYEELDEVIKKSKRHFNLIHNAQNMCQLIQNADLAITGGGNTMFEIACLGVPAIVVCGDTFEEETADRMDKWGIVDNLGFGLNVSQKKILKKTRLLMKDTKKRSEMSINGRKRIDGRGAERVVQLINDNLSQRKASIMVT